MYYDDYDGYGDERARRRKVFAAAGVVALLLAALAFWQFGRGSDPENVTSALPSTSSASATTTLTGSLEANPDARDSNASNALDSNAQTTSTTTEGLDDPTASTVAATNAPTNTPDPSGTDPVTSVDSAATTVAANAATLSDPQLGYPTSPDGTPLPVLVIFDVETITISGQVPTQAARDRLGALAIANSQFPDAELIDNMVINPAMPISVGVRVIELNSARFPEGTAQILPDHARELDRVVTIMEALPNISVLVVGHADQRGDELENFATSDERARAVVNYLLYLGIAPTRLASRAAGESDLLTIGDDEFALALNRRTEFVFYGLLVE